MKPRLFVALAIATILATSWYACGGSGGSSNSTPTSPSGGSTTSSATMFEGTIAGSGGQSGAFSVTIQTAVAASSVASLRSAGLTIKPLSFTQVSGTLNVAGGASVPLAGTYDSSTNAVGLSGGGFTFTGTISGAVLSGTYTGPSNSSGGFSSLNATQNAVTAYCGTFTDPLPGDSGIFNMQVSANGTVSGVAFPTTATGGSPTTFTGQLNGINLNITSAEGNTGTGTVQNGTVNGTLAATRFHGAGTFTGSAGACSLPPPPPAATVFPFSIVIQGTNGAFTTTLQNQTMTNGQYDFILAPGTYTISGRLSSPGSNVGVNLIHHSPVNCHTPTCPGGVVPGSLHSSISCGGTDCNPPTSSSCPTKPTQPVICVAPGGKGAGTTTSCGAFYTSFSAEATCVPSGDPSGGCAQQQNPYVPMDFQLQFTVDGTIASNASCQ